MIFRLKNFFLDEFISFKNEDKLNQVVLLVYSFFPVFLIIGTAVSEIGIIFLFFFSLYFFYLNKINIFKNSLTYGLIFIYFALLINLFFSEDFSNSFLRNFFFIKYIIFTLGTIIFFSEKKFRIFFVYKTWILTMVLFAIDMYVQFFIGQNIIGIESPVKFHRVSGFMGDELKAGSLILSLGLFLSCYLIENKNYKNIGIILIFFFVSAIFISGDRSNFIKSLLIIMIIIFFLDKKIIKKFLFLIGILFMFVIFVIINYDTFAERYQNQIYKNFSKYNYNVFDYINSTEYGKLYHTGIVLFLNNKTFGVGNKNFRLLCDENEREKFLIKNNIKHDKKLINQKFEEKFRCNTHPHQIYIEILSEHGIFGFIVLISLIILFVKQNLFVILKHKNTVLACKFLIILSTFIPLIPGGSFFTSFNATLFWINIGLFYSYKNLYFQKSE